VGPSLRERNWTGSSQLASPLLHISLDGQIRATGSALVACMHAREKKNSADHAESGVRRAIQRRQLRSVCSQGVSQPASQPASQQPQSVHVVVRYAAKTECTQRRAPLSPSLDLHLQGLRACSLPMLCCQTRLAEVGFHGLYRAGREGYVTTLVTENKKKLKKKCRVELISMEVFGKEPNQPREQTAAPRQIEMSR
jgi:hypothetical protein